MKTNSCKKGFTLIELLVVVLIIGILAAIALPQYKKAVWKSRAAELQTLTKSMMTAQLAFYTETNRLPTTFTALDLEFPCTQDPALASSYGFTEVCVKDNKYALALAGKTMAAMFLDGPYAGAGFAGAAAVQVNGVPMKIGEMYCAQPSTDFGFCNKLFSGTSIGPVDGGYYMYKLP